MALFGISDLHLSFGTSKPMDVFGVEWKDHAQRMATAWDRVVGPQDVVLCPGDLSWASTMEEAQPDLAWIGARPGIKVLGRGNHDHWWNTLTKVRAGIPKGCVAIQHDAVEVGNHVVCGTRLWSLPGSAEFTPQDQKIFDREVGRLTMALDAGKRLAHGRPWVVSVHYPPFGPQGAHTPFSRLICDSGATLCVYGHLHGAASHQGALEGVVDGVAFHLIACDRLGFVPKALAP